MEIKNLKKTAKRILKAIKSKERIIIYGDADLDGVTSVIILKECLKNLGKEISEIYFPDRENDGYGITEKGLFYLKKHSPTLFLALDCGIGNFKEVKIAKEIGFEVIIIDHHEILDKLPDADIIIDPKQKGDRYPFKQFATVGIVFRLAKLLLGKKMSEILRRDFLELAAMATIADMMPRTDDNEEIICQGLSSLRESWRPGIQALFGLEPFQTLTLIQQVNKINSLLNIRDIENSLPASYRLLTIADKKEAEKMARNLLEKGIEKKMRIQDIKEEIEEKVLGKEKDPIIFEGSSDWELILLGIVASILSQQYQKPVFLYKKEKINSQGSVRAPAGFNTVEAMKSCSQYFNSRLNNHTLANQEARAKRELLITYGGHPAASGFKIKNENLEKFKEFLIKFYEK